MKQKWKVIFGAICLLLLSGAVYGQKLPDGKGKAELIQDCTACHGTKMIVQERRTPQEWKKVVDDMAARESDSTPKDVENIVRYLSTNFGIKKTCPDAKTQSTAPSASAPKRR